MGFFDLFRTKVKSPITPKMRDLIIKSLDVDDFSDNWNQISSEFISNIGDNNFRILFLHFFLTIVEPKDLRLDDNKSMGRYQMYWGFYREIMKIYFQFGLEMYKDIYETEYYKRLDIDERRDFMEYHREQGNKVLNHL